jgi:hypothetical protein
MKMRTLIIAALAALAITAVAAPAAQAREFEGLIVDRNAKAKTFSIRQDEGGGTFKVKVNRGTEFERVNGFKAIRVGRTDIEVTARKANGRWIATKVETRGGSGGGSGGSGGGNDD